MPKIPGKRFWTRTDEEWARKFDAVRMKAFSDTLRKMYALMPEEYAGAHPIYAMKDIVRRLRAAEAKVALYEGGPPPRISIIV